MKSSETSNNDKPLLSREEIIQKAGILLPDLIGQTSISGVNLRDLLMNADVIKQGTGLESDRFSMSAIGLQESDVHQRIDMRYLQDLSGTNGREIEDTVQLMFHTKRQPWGRTDNETIFVNWTETGEPIFSELYINFVDTGIALGITEGEITLKPYRNSKSPRLSINPRFDAVSRPQLLAIEYSGYPTAAHRGLLRIPTAIRSPRIGLMNLDHVNPDFS